MLRIAVGGQLGEFSPTNHEAGWSSAGVPWVFEKFVSLDARGELIPVLATRVERGEGGVIRLEVPAGGRFSDGSPIEASDVVRSLEVVGLRVTREGKTFAVASAQQGIPTEGLLLQAVLFRDAPGHPGSGPFTVVSQTASEIRFRRRTPQPGRIDDVRLSAYPTPRDAYAHTLKGDANFVFDLDSRWLEFFQGVPSMQVVRIPPKNTDTLMFNGRMPRAERRALAAVLDSEEVRQLAYGNGECAESRKAMPSNVTVPPGPPLRILAWGSFERLGLAARRVLGQRGGELSVLDPQDVLSRVHRGEFDMITLHPNRWPPSSLALIWRTGSPYNLTGYSNPELDRAVDSGDWAAAEAVVRDDPPGAFVCTRDFFAVVDARIRDARFGPSEILETLPDWEVVE